MKTCFVLVALFLAFGLIVSLFALLHNTAQASSPTSPPYPSLTRRGELTFPFPFGERGRGVRSETTTTLRYVATTGSDTTDCTNNAAPCRTAQYAVDQAYTGDEIRIATGVYTGVNNYGGSSQVVYISKTVSVRGGYTTTNWTVPNPISYPTTLDAQSQGRVMYITGNISPTVEGLHITGGQASDGGGVYLLWASSITISNSWILSNTATSGGGLYLWYTKATLVSNIIYGNQADNGGGVYLWAGHGDNDVLLSDNVISNNTAAQWGGGIHLWDSEHVTLEGNTIFSNTAQQYGGGIWLNFSRANLQDNVVRDNQAIAGGGIYLRVSNFTPLTNNVIMDNLASSSGGGLYITGGNYYLRHNTFARNNSGDGSGVYVTTYSGAPAVHSTVALTNSILASHTLGISVSAGNTVTVNGILWYSMPITIAQTGVSTVTVQNEYWGDPAFTADRYHLTAASAAIDRGAPTSVTHDIDGNPRPLGYGFDLGADEYQSLTPGVPVLVSPLSGTVTTTQAITFAWQAGAGDPPESYNLQLDGAIFTTTATISPALLSLGIHTWTVRAFNAAGQSAWVSPAWTIELTTGLAAPGVPVLLSPPSGTVTTAQAITFAWQAGAGDLPESYNLQLDGAVFTTTATISPALLSLGIHTWTVRAFNAAGQSAWVTPAWTVEVKRYCLYLPIVLK